MAQLNGKVVIVTGAARGIGQAIATKMAAAGADIALCDLQKDWLVETEALVKNLGRRAATYAVDVSKTEDVQAVVDQVEKDFGRIDGPSS